LRVFALLIVLGAGFIAALTTPTRAQDRALTGNELWDCAHASGLKRSEHLPPFVAYFADRSFVVKGKTRVYHCRYMLRTRD